MPLTQVLAMEYVPIGSGFSYFIGTTYATSAIFLTYATMGVAQSEYVGIVQASPAS